MWVMEAVEAIVGLAYAYDTLKNGGSGDTDKLLNSIIEKLGDIKDELVQVNRELDRIIDLLVDLPLVVKGAVEAAALKTILGELQQNVGLIKDNIRPDRIIQEHEHVRGYLDGLRLRVGAVVGLRGVSGALLCAPYIGVWLSASVALEKALMRNDPSYLVFSPWSSDFMVDMKDLFDDLFFQAESLDFEFENDVIPRFPKHGVELQIVNGKFNTADITTLEFYRLSCPINGQHERVEVREGGPRPPPFPSLPITWRPADKRDQKANSTYTKLNVDRKAVTTFYNWLPELYKSKNDLLNVFIEPPNYW